MCTSACTYVHRHACMHSACAHFSQDPSARFLSMSLTPGLLPHSEVVLVQAPLSTDTVLRKVRRDCLVVTKGIVTCSQMSCVFTNCSASDKVPSSPVSTPTTHTG